MKLRKIKIKRKSLYSLLKFLIIFNLLALPMYAIIYLDVSFPALQGFLADITSKSLQSMGYSAVSDGYYITLLSENQIARIEISFDCTGWKSLWCLTALALATPVKNDKKIKFLILALPSLFVINFFRIVTTILAIFNFGFQYLDIVHTLLWREFMIILVVALWYFWLKGVKYNTLKNNVCFRWILAKKA